MANGKKREKIVANSKTGGSDDVEANGKYLLISVPEFAEDPINPGKKMTSYLRLGAASTTWRDDPGGELAARIALSGPAGAHLTPARQEVDITGDKGDERPVFIDDTRGREGSSVPHQLSVGDRLKQSEVLHTRGGWRDHSDGNRITTTYGDKIEVIRGNYKMVVLGRQDDPSAASGWDASGQHIQDFASTKPGASVRVEWVKDYGGVWHLQNTTEGVVQSSNYAGDFYEYWWGDHHETTIGSEAPVAKLPEPDGRPRGNPHIINKTWAEKIESYTGSAALPIPMIQQHTFATTGLLTLNLGSVSLGLKFDDINAELTVKTAKLAVDIGAASLSTAVGAINANIAIGAANMNAAIGAMNVNAAMGAVEVNAAAGVIAATMALGTMDMAVAAEQISAAMVMDQINLATYFNTINLMVFSPEIALFLGPMMALTAMAMSQTASNFALNASNIALG